MQGNMELLIANQQRMLDEQRKLVEEVHEIRIRLLTGAQAFEYIRIDIGQIAKKVETLEQTQIACPARKRAEGWAATLRDLGWLVALGAAVATVAALFKKG